MKTANRPQWHQPSVWVLLYLGLTMACQPQKETNATSDSQTTAQIICGTAPSDKAWYSSGQKAVLFDSLGDLSFPITTQSPEAQRYFNQGIMLAVGFNHAEAARSFYEAMRLDSTCAMAYWGFSYVLGPNYNAGMEPDNYERAYKAVREAMQLSANCTDKEKALINALAKRYSAKPVEDRRAYDEAYSKAIQQVHEQFPDDADIAALYAESLMDLHPWDLWEHDAAQSLGHRALLRLSKNCSCATPTTLPSITIIFMLLRLHERPSADSGVPRFSVK